MQDQQNQIESQKQEIKKLKEVCEQFVSLFNKAKKKAGSRYDKKEEIEPSTIQNYSILEKIDMYRRELGYKSQTDPSLPESQIPRPMNLILDEDEEEETQAWDL